MSATLCSMLFSLLICLSVILSYTSAQQSTITTACNAASDCTECMAAHPTCNWCITKATNGWSGTKRCDVYDNHITKNCLPVDIKNITTDTLEKEEVAVRDATDSGLPAIQVSPQRIKLKLRPNEKVKVPLTFRLAKDYPVDLYYLMDLSQSMDDDKKKVANLGIKLADEMRKITKDVRLGFGSFVDKVLMPYVNTLEDRLEAPCSNCESPYSFKHRLTLSEDTSIFGTEVNKTQVSGNLDGPEGGFDALMQAIVCDTAIGWRPNSRKMLIFSTDASFHSAGDGKLGGVVEPNDGLCHMTDGEYTWGTRQDYPSISQIASKVADNRVNVIFAVTADQTSRYQNLMDFIPGSVTGTLASDSGNIVQLVRENYEKISSKVVMTIRRQKERLEGLNIKVRASCDNSGVFSETAECDKLSPGGQVKFEVELQATSCDNVMNGTAEEMFEVYPTGLTESLRITAQIDCACECDDTELNSDICTGKGTYQCGTCECGDTSYGDKCQCDISDVGSDITDINAPCIRPSNLTQSQQQPCSGRGECVCGLCERCDCLPGSNNDKNTCRRFTGDYCQCNPDNCPRNLDGICSNRGQCTCDEDTAVHTCQCESGYTGPECECQISQETCKDPSNTENPNLLCNGQGVCDCGKCKCYIPKDGNSERFTGKFCEECSGCPSKCQPFKQCVQCQVHEKLGWDAESYDEVYCAQSCGNASSIEFTFVKTLPTPSDIRQCAPYTSVSDDCLVRYSYKYLPNRGGYTVYIQDEKECPFKPNLLAIILGVIGGVVFIGLIILLIWKLVTTLHDRREFAKFEKERQQAQWKSNENPIYVQATSTFKNPMYQGGTNEKS